MLYPFKSLICRSVGTPQRHFLIGTSGFSIYIFDLISNDLVSVWPSSKDHGSPLEETPRAPPAETSCHLHEQHVCEVPIKRRKITPSEDASKNSLSKFGFNQNEVLNTLFSRVITLTGTSDGKYVIVVTEDKTIRVLELSLDGILSQLSERQASFYQIFRFISN